MARARVAHDDDDDDDDTCSSFPDSVISVILYTAMLTVSDVTNTKIRIRIMLTTLVEQALVFRLDISPECFTSTDRMCEGRDEDVRI